MAYHYPPLGGASPIIPPQAITPVPRAVTPSIGPPTGQVAPGSLTYTTTQGPDGQITYHLFKATPASYQTPQGVVTGIQWIPAEATAILPPGATPASADILASFNRPGDERYRDWQRDEDRRRRDIDKELRRDEKERRRQEREDERELEREIRRARERDDRDRLRRDDKRRSSGYAYERDLDRSFRDMDVRDRDRERERDREYEREKARSNRGSMYGEPPAGYPSAPMTTGYPVNPVGGYSTAPAGYTPSSPYATTAAQPYSPGGQAYAGAGQAYPAVGGYTTQPVAPRPVSPYQAAAPRPVSPYAAPGIIPPRAASPYAPPPRATSPYAPPPPPRAASPYAAPPPLRAASPYQSGAVIPPPPSRSPYQAPGTIQGVYPPGHVMEGRLATGRAPSPSPYGGATPGGYPTAGYPQTASGYATPAPAYPTAQVPGAIGAYPPPPGAEAAPMPAPEGFSRPPNLAQSYTRFETLKIQDMDDFFENIPRMPLVLVPHDVYHEDWIRLMTDLSLAWSGKLPVPDYARDGRVPKRTTLTADLIDLWNASFFLKRGVEIVLFKGRERRSGRNSGSVELHLPGFDDLASYSDDSESEDDSSEDDSDLEDRYRYGSGHGGAYGRGVEAQMAELREVKRERRERKRAEKRRRKQEKKQRRKQKEAERKYAFYVTCVPIEP
ncbi:hypothetical protein BDY19DRAFT_990616 [Irpex rosettiformis]|uniref:Uncharacterized protein n=1 Tax=Irpex rosettiformis TaxID=378272 RepID=A0ACB8UBW1_9APHY|nr:hypothetical protein BDY19DRAFT_990616 [Irpex rosettiformis]